MDWLTPVRGQIVGIDTAPFIYFIERHPSYLETVRPFFQALEQGEFRAVTSVVTLLEVLVQPIRQNDLQLAQEYRDILLRSDNLVVVPFSLEIAEEAAQLRAQHNLRTPDAIQIATAVREGANFLLTNDARFPSLPGPDILVLDKIHS